MIILHESDRYLAEICAAAACLGVLYNLLAAALVVRFARSPKSRASLHSPVSILKPLRGSEPGLFSRLTSFCQQDYPERVQLVCGTQLAADKAIPVVRRLQRLNPGAQIDLVVGECRPGTNRKIANLVGMESAACYDTIVLSDSDIVVDERFLSRIAAELEHVRVGAVTCIYYGIPSGGMWAQVSALNINSQFLPNVIVALALRAAKPCFGSAIAMRKATLTRIGGLSSFMDELADDYAIGRAVRAAGLEVVVPRFAVGHVCFEDSFRIFWQHHMRCSRTIRSIDPVGYAGLIFMHPFMLALIAALSGAPYPLAVMTAGFASRAILSTNVQRAFRLRRQRLWLLILHDAISFAVFVSSFFGTAVKWRGCSYRILRDGTVENTGTDD